MVQSKICLPFFGEGKLGKWWGNDYWGRWGKNKVGKSLGFSHLWRIGDSAGTQTQDPQLRRLLLYSAELPNQILLGLMHKNVL